METIRIVIADNHPLVRCGIRETLRGADEITLVGEASRGDEVQRLCRELQPDVLLLDLQMPGATATETIKCVQEACRATRVIILTAYDDAVYVRGMLAAGAMGYVLKDEVAEVVLTAVRSVMQGGTWFSRRVLEVLATESPSTEHLTEREHDVFALLATGSSNKEIARHLHISEHTVESHVSHILHKLNVESRLEAVLTFRPKQ